MENIEKTREELMLDKLASFENPKDEKSSEEIFFVVLFKDPIKVSDFKKMFDYKHEYFDTNEMTIPVGIFGNVADMSSVGVATFDKEADKIVTIPQINGYLEGYTVEKIKEALKISFDEPIRMLNYDNLSKDEVIKKMTETFMEIDAKNSDLGFLTVCSEQLQKECVSKTCSKCSILSNLKLRKLKV